MSKNGTKVHRMRLRMFIVVALISSLFVTPAISASNPKEGKKCPAVGFEQEYKSRKFVCLKVSKKLQWKDASKIKPNELPKTKGLYDFSKTYSTDDGYLDDFIGGPCSLDPNVPKEWAEMQAFIKNLWGCAGQLRVAKYTLGNLRPKTNLNNATEFNNLSKCKISVSNDSKGLSHGFNSWREEKKHPSPNSVIQLIPIYGSDTEKPKNSPKQDYGKYLEFIREWIDISSDFGSKAEIRIPTEYIEFNGKVADYDLSHPVNHNTPGHVRFNNDVIAAVDSVINFSGANIGIVVAPPGTDASIMEQAALGSFQTNEGKVPVALSQFADLPKNPKGSEYSGLSHPFWWIHEMYHAGFGLDDHYGDTKNNINSDYGMGWWTMMVPWGGDLSAWEKWILGFIKDSQVQCVETSVPTLHWIAPSSVNTKESKLVVIPISTTKVVVIESIRPAGLYYKIPQSAAGVLVYEIDLSIDKHGYGMKLSLPKNRIVSNWEFSSPMFLGGALLKTSYSDYTVSNGYKISVVEAGTFGDVVKVEKI